MDLLMNLITNQNQVDLTYFTGFLGRPIKYLYVYHLCRLLIYGHQICIIDASRISALTDSL